MIILEQFTEDEVQDIFEDVYAEFYEHRDKLGFDDYYVSKIVDYLGKNNRKTLGLCTERNGKFKISLNPNILKFEQDGEKIIRETVAHELCHTLPGCMNHGKNFHAKASLIKRLMGYNIDTKADIDSTEYFMKYLPQSNYMVRCDNCGSEVPLSRMSNMIKNPSSYTCAKCGGSISSYILDKNTGEYELYASSDSEPDYKYWVKCDNCDYKVPYQTKTKSFRGIEDLTRSGYKFTCPRCYKKSLYVIDNGKEIRAD